VKDEGGWDGCIRTWDVKDEADGMDLYGPGM